MSQPLTNLGVDSPIPVQIRSWFEKELDVDAPVAASKWACEVYLENYARELGLPMWIHRPSYITGINAPITGIIGNLFEYSVRVEATPNAAGRGGLFDMVPVEEVATVIASSVSRDKMVAKKKTRASLPVYVQYGGQEEVPAGNIIEHLEKKHNMSLEDRNIEDDYVSSLNKTQVNSDEDSQRNGLRRVQITEAGRK
ncbi:hypothetical protein CkaCkLH20_11619 [Colletotrichum karsti]|uniref:Thioester reductase (TE) domain-containing protein n=1 Tax=Colletotrichum karsti TaxID=1095194 RepID=A0A9P6LG14_9PEZI|nr:uncharacterized protein CkaCkLH20_11619 [Colletotrichum karsti]KAF9870947.1 hypothetical protein CkaCkLH20_11619 [Colletotrichum karsti]